MSLIIILVLAFGILSATSIVFTGGRNLIAGEVNTQHITRILTNWQFYLAMSLAVLTRGIFMLINNRLLAIPAFNQNSTTITAMVSASSYIFIVLFNFWFLDERLSLINLFGIGLIIAGIVFVFIK